MRATSGYKTAPNGAQILVRGAEALAKDYVFANTRITTPLLVGEVTYKQACRRFQGGVCPYEFGLYLPGGRPAPGQNRDNTCQHYHACAYCGAGDHPVFACPTRNRWLGNDPANRRRPPPPPPETPPPTSEQGKGSLRVKGGGGGGK